MSSAGGAIWIVDDEPALSKMMGLFLKRRGYTVVTFNSTEKAWQQFQADPAAVRAAVVDLSMPGMDTREFGIRLLSTNPSIYVIFCSGYPADFHEVEAAAAGRVAFLHKPFTPEMLEERLRSLLG